MRKLLVAADLFVGIEPATRADRPPSLLARQTASLLPLLGVLLPLLACSATDAQILTEFGAGISPRAQPMAITAGPDGNMWFTEFGAGRIGRITREGAVTEFNTGIGPYGVVDITAGPDGNVWFTEGALNRVGRITPTGVVTEFSTGISPGANLQGIALGPDGNIWFTEINAGGIGRINTTGIVTEFSVGMSPGAAPFAITRGLDGNLWFTEPIKIGSDASRQPASSPNSTSPSVRGLSSSPGGQTATYGLPSSLVGESAASRPPAS